ncbi:hypothetical protein [uncultured Thomasclavelia sp.]|uniref:hypothetical protein n=1 Tax=uncultured Thomasclavelia sp. TaxID=3025759 RepID=UPI0025D3468F|nr:hypothetical protein [uncultured Thomasclavelia sp.]
MLARLHVVIDSENDQDYLEVKQKLLTINPDFSISPNRPYQLIKDHSEFYITIDLSEDEVKPLLDQLNNDWTGEIDECDCYGFNTKMFDQRVYCLEFTYFND